MVYRPWVDSEYFQGEKRAWCNWCIHDRVIKARRDTGSVLTVTEPVVERMQTADRMWNSREGIFLVLGKHLLLVVSMVPPVSTEFSAGSCATLTRSDSGNPVCSCIICSPYKAAGFVRMSHSLLVSSLIFHWLPASCARSPHPAAAVQHSACCRLCGTIPRCLPVAGLRFPTLPREQRQTRWRKWARSTDTRCPSRTPPTRWWRRARRRASCRRRRCVWGRTCSWSWRCPACWWASGSAWWSATWTWPKRRWPTSPSPGRCSSGCWRWSSCRWSSAASSPAPPAWTRAPWANWGASRSPTFWWPRWSPRASGWPWRSSSNPAWARGGWTPTTWDWRASPTTRRPPTRSWTWPGTVGTVGTL